MPVRDEMRGARLRAVVPLLVDMAAPVAGYAVLSLVFGVPPVTALAAGAAVAGLRTLYRSVRQRRVSLFALMTLVILVVTLVLVFVTGDGRLVLAKSALVPFMGGVFGLLSTVTGRTVLSDVARPVVTGDDPALLRGWERAWSEDPAFVRRMKQLNLLWGAGFVVSAVARVVVIYQVPLGVAVFAGQVPTICMLLVLGGITARMGPPLARAVRERADGSLPAARDAAPTYTA